MELQAYLDRIGYQGAVAPTRECLVAIHRCHALAVPYENLDVQLGLPVSQDIGAIYDKIVTRRRGGWCYEMNGLLGWALSQAGFDVQRVTGGVFRRERGDAALGNHLVLLVHLDRTYVADLGLGDGIREPLPLEEGRYVQGSLEFRLENLGSGYWRLHNHGFGHPADWDFHQDAADEPLLDATCSRLQRDPASTFVLNLDCELMRADSLVTLTGRVLRHKTAAGTEKTVMRTVDDMHAVLAAHFGITGVDLAPVWPKIVARHEDLFGTVEAD